MKYKLLKDTPTIKAGTIFEEIVNMSDGTRELSVAVPGEDIPQDPQFTIQDIDNFDEWFEKVEDSIHYEPEDGDEYFYISDYGHVYSDIWRGNYTDNERLALGFIYPTEEECEKARERELAKVRLRRASTFKPDFENNNGGWVVFYSYVDKELHSMRDNCTDSGELVRYETKEDAEKSIRENREDWLIYFGIKEDKDPSDTDKS